MYQVVYLPPLISVAVTTECSIGEWLIASPIITIPFTLLLSLYVCIPLSLPPMLPFHQYLSANHFFFTCRLSLSTAPGVSQYSLISVFPSATPFDIQGIPGLMHCKFFSIMNCDGRIKGMDMEHNLQRNVRDTEVVKALMNLNQQS